MYNTLTAYAFGLSINELFEIENDGDSTAIWVDLNWISTIPKKSSFFYIQETT